MTKILLLLLAAVLLIYSPAEAQAPIPEGASNFFKELGGLRFSQNEADILQRIAGNKIDKVESGGGGPDWTKVDGRVFVRAAWMIEIGEIASDYGSFELEQSIAAEMQRKLRLEGFSLTPVKFDLHYVRYQNGSTVGTVEVRSFFLGIGNLPLRYEFIFNESYMSAKKSGKSRVPGASARL